MERQASTDSSAGTGATPLPARRRRQNTLPSEEIARAIQYQYCEITALDSSRDDMLADLLAEFHLEMMGSASAHQLSLDQTPPPPRSRLAFAGSGKPMVHAPVVTLTSPSNHAYNTDDHNNDMNMLDAEDLSGVSAWGNMTGSPHGCAPVHMRGGYHNSSRPVPSSYETPTSLLGSNMILKDFWGNRILSQSP